MRTWIAVTAIVALAACARDAQSTLLPASAQDSSASTASPNGRLVLRVRVPRHSDSLSPATAAISVRIAGPTKVHKEAALAVGATGCTSRLTTVSCSLLVPNLKPCPAKRRCYKATVATYDAFDAATGKIPPAAHELSAEIGFTFTISAADTVVPLVLEGIPASVAFLPSPASNLTGSQAAGYVEPKCSAASQSVDVVSVDADGNYIVGAGAPAVRMTSSNSAQFAVAASGPKAPNEFELVPPPAPNYPFGNASTTLSISATPGSKSGAKAVGAAVKVAYSGDICGTFTEFDVPTAASEPSGVVLGPDGNMWFSEQAGDKIAKITATGSITEFPLPTAAADPVSIAVGPGGNLWFTEAEADKIGEATTAGAVTEFAVPTANAEPFGIVEGPDGNVWFTELAGKKVAKMTPAGAATEFPNPGGYEALSITDGPDGNLWFTDVDGNVSRITIAGTIAQNNVALGIVAGILTGPNGLLWFTETQDNAVGEITTGAIVEAIWMLPEPGSAPEFLTVGPDGAIWFTETSGNRIARIEPGGQVTEFAVPTSASGAQTIATGADGALWFSEITSNKIGRLF